MKSIIERNFPYPILLENGGDYNDARFNVECKTRLSDDSKELIMSFNFIIECPTIRRLIEEGKAFPFVNVSQRTYRKSGPLINGNEFKIPMDWLSPNHNLEVMPMLVAKSDFDFDYDESMNLVFSYFDDSFKIKRGQILGYGNFLTIELPTNSKIGSIFTISKLKKKEDIDRGLPYIISLDTHAIDIKVLPDIYDSFFKLKDTDSSYRKLLYSTFVYPAVQMAILNIFQDYDGVKDYKWCIAITNKISKLKGINFETKIDFTSEEIIEYTNLVLETLLQDAFNDIDKGGEE